MSRLFITPRELNFISDINKEIIKDVAGQRIYYYPINENKTKIDDIYNEAPNKAFDGPVILDALVDAQFQDDTKINQFGIDTQFKIEAFVHYRDMVEKGIEISVGDFFSFGEIFYEITEMIVIKSIFGLPEHKDGVKLVGTRARNTQFKAPILGPTDISDPSPSAIQTTFEQQRGAVRTSEGLTGDVRALQADTILGAPITGPKEISPKGDTEHSGASSFYGEEEDE